MLKLEDRVDLSSIAGSIFFCLLQGYCTALAHSDRVCPVQNLPAHLLDILMNAGTVGTGIVDGIAVEYRPQIRQTRLLGKQAQNIHPEAIHALVQPPVHHPENFLPDLRVLPVQIRLFFGEEMEVIHLSPFVKLPSTSGKAGAPVIGKLAVFAFPPDVVITVRIVNGFPALNKPGMLVGSMVYHQIHNEAEAVGMGRGQHLIKILHRAKFLHDGLIIADIVAIVIVRRLVNRRKPDHVHTELLKIIHFFNDAPEIANAVSVAVLKASGIDLINHGFLPPEALRLHQRDGTAPQR